jgi:hypothetical protein
VFRWLAKLGKASRTKPTREALLNEGLDLAMDWGEDWLAPIQGRLAKRHPDLRRDQLDELDAVCQEAMRFGHETAYDLVRRQGKGATQDTFVPLVIARYSWITSETADRLFNMSMYYAWKTGGPLQDD